MKMTFLKPFMLMIAGVALAACVQPNPDDPDNPHSVVTWRALGDQQIPILNEGARMADAAAAV